MQEDTPNYTETTNRLNTIIEPLFAKHHRQKCYLGLIFQQGKRNMVQINVPAHDLPTLLQAKPSTGNDPDSGKNRPEVKGHSEEIKEYILKRINKNKPWILGTLTANVDPQKIELIELGRGLCIVIIPRGVKLDITDGQHRKRAIHELIESEVGELIGDNDFPITLVLEESFSQCQTDFRDMAQTEKLSPSLLLSFGEFEGLVGITKKVIEQVSIFYGKTEKVAKSPSNKNKLIYTTNYISKLVSCAFTNDPQNELKDYDVDKSSEALINCLNQFFNECHQTRHIFATKVENLSIKQVEDFKEDCILGVSVGMEILGRLLYCTYIDDRNEFNAEDVSRLAQLNWSRESELWQGNIVLIEPNPKKPNKPYKITTGINAIKIAVNRTKEYLGWT